MPFQEDRPPAWLRTFRLVFRDGYDCWNLITDTLTGAQTPATVEFEHKSLLGSVESVSLAYDSEHMPGNVVAILYIGDSDLLPVKNRSHQRSLQASLSGAGIEAAGQEERGHVIYKNVATQRVGPGDAVAITLQGPDKKMGNRVAAGVLSKSGSFIYLSVVVLSRR